MKKYYTIFLGGGNSAGYAAAEFIRLGGQAKRLCIITDEKVTSYERPALSKAYLNPIDTKPPRLPGFNSCVGGGGERQTAEWYQQKGIDYMVDTKITGVQLKEKVLTSSAGEQFAFEKLIIGTGVRPTTLKDFQTPGYDAKGIYYLRNVADADKLIEAMENARSTGKTKAIVIGGGYIGMEVACALINNSLQPTLVFPESRLLERLFTPEMGAWYQQYYENKGAKFMKGCLVKSVNKDDDGAVKSVTLNNGSEIEADLVVAGLGSRPNTEIVGDQLTLAPVNPREGQIGGIQVNGHFVTSDPDVYAVGDVAAFPIKLFGGQVTRQEHVTHCRSSAIQAMAHIMAPGSLEEYDYLPFFYSRVFDLSWQYYGTSSGGTPVQWMDKENSQRFGTIWVDSDSKVIGGFIESGTPEEQGLLKAMARKRPVVNAEDFKAQGVMCMSKL